MSGTMGGHVSNDTTRVSAGRSSADLSDPRAKGWGGVPVVRVALTPVPLAAQPSRYIRTAWAERPYGVIREVCARAAHDGERLYVLVDWDSPTRRIAQGAENPFGEHPVSGPDAFPDSLAVIFPADGDAPLQSMGADGAAVSMWRWAAGVPDTVESLVAHGIGSEQPVAARTGLLARSAGGEARWSVVLSRPLQAAGGEEPSFQPGGSVRVAFAVWCGANQERAGLAACSRAWIDLVLEG